MWSIGRPTGFVRGAGTGAAFARIAAALVADVERGALRPGDRLPSTRALARQLRVNRNTAVAAYDELLAQGWIVSRGPAGTFVSDDLPVRPVRRPARAPQGLARQAGFAVPAVAAPWSPTPPARFQVSLGVPDTRLLPTAALARAWRRAVQSRAGRNALDYGPPHGAPRLRAAIAAMLRETRGVPVGPEHVLITRGSQMGLALAAQLTVRPGGVAAVEELGYPPAWAALTGAGARLEAVALDDAGLVVDALPERASCVYVTPHHQYPTAVLMAPARRLALLARAGRDGFAVLEDDYDHEFHFEGRPVAPLASADPGGNVVYVGTLSKILAPGLRLGFVVAPVPVIEAMAALRQGVDRHGDHVLEHAVAAMIDDGELQRHVRKMRGVYAGRREALARALRRELGSVLSFTLPAGGLTLWARVDDGVSVEAWRQRALAAGVAMATARDYALDGRSRPFVRLAFALHDEAELAEAVRLLARTLRPPRTRGA